MILRSRSVETFHCCHCAERYALVACPRGRARRMSPACSRRHSSTHRSPRAPTASRSISPTTTPARTTRSTAAAATRSPPPRWPGAPATRSRRVDYTDAEHGIWRDGVAASSRPSTTGSRAAPSGRPRRGSRCRSTTSRSSTRSAPRSQPLTGFAFHPAAGLVPLDEFLRLARPTASSTRRSTCATRARPLYTPEPDIVHEVIGHGNLLADPRHRRGQAARRRGRAALRDARRRCSTSPTSSGSRSSSA